MELMIDVENISCGGCANAIKRALGGIAGVQGVDVEIDTGRVHVHAEAALRGELTRRLADLGYPERQAR